MTTFIGTEHTYCCITFQIFKAATTKVNFGRDMHVDHILKTN